MPQFFNRATGVLIAFLSNLLIAQAEPDRSDIVETALVVILVDSPSGNRICKGAAIGTRIVLTAAHCLLDAQLQATRVESRRGSIGVTSAKVHPLYSSDTRLPFFDLALLTTEKEITGSPLPIIKSVLLNPGDVFEMYQLGNSERESDRHSKESHQMVVADLEKTFLQYIDLKRGTFVHQKVVDEIESRLRLSDIRLRKKIDREFNGVMFSLYTKNRISICKGDSGAPAIISHNGKLGIVGVATAISDFEVEKNSSCPEGATSIFTMLNQAETLGFLQEFGKEVTFE